MKIRKTILFFKFVMFIFLFVVIINFISGYFSERVRAYVRQKAILESSYLISSTIKTDVLPNIDIDNLVKTTYNENSEVQSIFINTYQINNIMAETSHSIQLKLNNFANEDMQNLTLPLGAIISDTLFINVGPNLNIYIEPVGSVECDVVTNYQHYGINNTLLTISIVVKVQFVTIIPLQKNVIEVVTKIPIVVQIIQGKVPTYYYNNSNSEFIPHPVDLE